MGFGSKDFAQVPVSGSPKPNQNFLSLPRYMPAMPAAPLDHSQGALVAFWGSIGFRVWFRVRV